MIRLSYSIRYIDSGYTIDEGRCRFKSGKEFDKWRLNQLQYTNPYYYMRIDVISWETNQFTTSYGPAPLEGLELR